MLRNIDLAQLGLIIRNARTDRRLRQDQLAEAAGITKKYVSDIENGKNNLSFQVLARVVSVLQIPGEAIFNPAAWEAAGDEEKLLSSYRSCPEKYRGLLLNMTAHLVDELNRRA